MPAGIALLTRCPPPPPPRCWQAAAAATIPNVLPLCFPLQASRRSAAADDATLPAAGVFIATAALQGDSKWGGGGCHSHARRCCAVDALPAAAAAALLLSCRCHHCHHAAVALPTAVLLPMMPRCPLRVSSSPPWWRALAAWRRQQWQRLLEIKKCPSVTSRPVVYFSVVPKSSPEGISGEPQSIRLQ